MVYKGSEVITRQVGLGKSFLAHGIDGVELLDY